MFPVDHHGGVRGVEERGRDMLCARGAWWKLTYFISSVPLLRSNPKDS